MLLHHRRQLHGCTKVENTSPITVTIPNFCSLAPVWICDSHSRYPFANLHLVHLLYLEYTELQTVLIEKSCCSRLSCYVE
ncbi:hypothetical protein L2E82_16371 [Cichorium intybus]|uniref:Uncharacterized protein n=1 Tax=Cichorium intybus TaxID=13427 RepID=A0ACB9F6N1_CICIN|nr:hypothetical protein L2E82_16371 [Cichorium intybus]